MPTVAADWTTAIGTLLVAVAAVAIAIWSERRIDIRTRDERAQSEKRLADERALGESRLLEERRLSHEREQLTEAWSVQVEAARKRPEGYKPDDPAECPVAIVINRGRYTITRVEARFVVAGSVVGPRKKELYLGFERLPTVLAYDLSGDLGQADRAVRGVLTPGQALRIEGDATAIQHLGMAYPIIRWTDRWNIRWEHKQGNMHQVEESTEWQR